MTTGSKTSLFHTPCTSLGSPAGFLNLRIWCWEAETHSLHDNKYSIFDYSTVQSHISRDEAKNKVPKRTPSPHRSPGIVSFVYSAFLLNSHITVKYFWSHSKQQLWIQAWFIIQSHVVFLMQMTQMGAKLMLRQRPPQARQSNENHKPLHTGLCLCLQAAAFLLTLRTLLFADCSKSSICAQQS